LSGEPQSHHCDIFCCSTYACASTKGNTNATPTTTNASVFIVQCNNQACTKGFFDSIATYAYAMRVSVPTSNVHQQTWGPLRGTPLVRGPRPLGVPTPTLVVRWWFWRWWWGGLKTKELPGCISGCVGGGIGLSGGEPTGSLGYWGAGRADFSNPVRLPH